MRTLDIPSNALSLHRFPSVASRKPNYMPQRLAYNKPLYTTFRRRSRKCEPVVQLWINALLRSSVSPVIAWNSVTFLRSSAGIHVARWACRLDVPCKNSNRLYGARCNLHWTTGCANRLLSRSSAALHSLLYRGHLHIRALSCSLFSSPTVHYQFLPNIPAVLQADSIRSVSGHRRDRLLQLIYPISVAESAAIPSTT